jgi:hypothetical protein
MDDVIYVTRHGDRWAVRESLDTPPRSEHFTREEAELAARALAREQSGARVEVREDDHAGLAGEARPDGPAEEPNPRDALTGQGRARYDRVQSGL